MSCTPRLRDQSETLFGRPGLGCPIYGQAQIMAPLLSLKALVNGHVREIARIHECASSYSLCPYLPPSSSLLQTFPSFPSFPPFPIYSPNESFPPTRNSANAVRSD